MYLLVLIFEQQECQDKQATNKSLNEKKNMNKFKTISLLILTLDQNDVSLTLLIKVSKTV